MCDRCTELDERIEHYRVLLVRIRDPQTVEAIAALIDRLRQRISVIKVRRDVRLSVFLHTLIRIAELTRCHLHF